MSDRGSGETILAFILGGLIGTALGMMYAPRPGRETREKLKDLSNDLAENFEQISDEIKEKGGEIITEGKERIATEKHRIETAYEAGRKAFGKPAKQS